MNRLIILANPSKNSFTYKILEKITNIFDKKWDRFEILDLYNTDLKQDFLNYEDKKEIWNNETTKKIQEKITNSDELIFIFPIWWWDMPAIMKNFFDCNFTAWYAYKYEKWKQIWLLNWKNVRVITTTWWPYILYRFIINLKILWNLNRVVFNGMKLKSFTIFPNMDRSKTDKDKYLNKLSKIY